MGEVVIIGSGVVGASIAYGLLKKGVSVTVVDEGAEGFNASKGNFGLVWCQGKGFQQKDYSRITFQSCQQWQDFATTLERDSGTSVDYENKGGLYFLMDEESHKQRIDRLDSIFQDSDGQIDFEMLDHDQLKKQLPELGSDVYSASFCRHDGTCDPLKLLFALKQAIINLGGKLVNNSKVTLLSCLPDGKVSVQAGTQGFLAEKVIIAAGLGNTKLSAMAGMETPLKAIKGEILVSQRLPKLLDLPSLQVRQTKEGTVICGDSHEDVGFKTNTLTPVLQKISSRAVKIFPMLSRQNVNRAWGALRVMTPDTMPVYQQSPKHKGIFNVSCHSGVTLAAFHANELAAHIISGGIPGSLNAFRGDRF